MDGTAVTFLVIGGIGAGVLVLSLLVGEIGGALHLSADADGPFSVPAIAALIGGIGFGGAAAVAVLPDSLPDAVTVLIAVVVGLAVAIPLAWAAIRLSRSLQNMPTQETLTRDHLVGAQGVVISSVPSAGFGEVRLAVAGQQLKFSARSDVPLPTGTPVYVTEALSDTAVEVVSTAPDPLPQSTARDRRHSVTLLISIAGIVLLAILLVLFVLSRIKVAGPNQAFIVTGRQGRQVTDSSGVISRDASGQKVVMGASVFVLPVVQKLHTMDLSSRRIPVGIRGAVSKQGVKCDLEGVAIVKVGGTEHSIRAAAQRFLNQQQGIDTFTSEVLAGALRSIVGRLTIEEIIRDRAAFASAVAEEAESSLTGQGLVLDTFQLQDIQAEGTLPGRPRAS